MSGSKFTQLLRGLRQYVVLALFMTAAFGDLSAQCSQYISAKPTFACLHDIDTMLFNPTNPVGPATFSVIPPGAATVVDAGSFIYISYNQTGDIIIVMSQPATPGPCPDDSIFVYVSPTIAPAITCNDTVNISLDENCEGTVTPDMVLEGNGYEFREYYVEVRDPITKIPIATSPNVNSSHLGQFFEVAAIHTCSGNSCWGILRVEDKLDPMLMCRLDSIDCGASTLPQHVHWPVSCTPVPIPGQPRTYRANCNDNCGAITLSYVDRTVQVVCPPASRFIDTIFRSWTAVDDYGNQTMCVDTIIKRAATIDDLVCPPNRDDISAPALKCGQNFKKDANGHPHPDVTGYPSGVNCRNINYTYTDIRLNICEGSYKVLREWLIIDWCTGDDSTCIQIIKVLNEAPIITCPTPRIDTVGTLTHQCLGVAELGLPLVIDSCSAVTWEVYVKRGVPNVQPNLIGATQVGVSYNPITKRYTIIDLPVGLNWVIFVGTDQCGGVDTCATEIFVKETTRPIAVCDLHTVVTLSDHGLGKVWAATFDDGSHDNCELDTMLVRRMFPGTCADTSINHTRFGPYVKFCCEDVATNPNIVVLRVYDKAGNWNECMVEVTVQDKKAPEIVACLPNITVDCTFDYSDLSVFGTYRQAEADRRNIVLNDPGNTTVAQPKLWGRDGLVLEDCYLHIDSSESVNINNCGEGTIIRRFTFRDNFSPPQSCTQIITVRNLSPFDITTVVFPGDTAFDGCLSAVDPSVTGEPSWPNVNTECSDIRYTYKDQVFNLVENACYKIIRTWTVIDWCRYFISPSTSKIVGTQIIKVTNSDAPIFTSPCRNVTFTTTEQGCSGFANLVASASDDCTPDDELEWRYEIDLDNDGSVDISGYGNSYSGNFSQGPHRITWYVKDGCGNDNTCSYLFSFRDVKKPTPVCRAGIITVVMPSTNPPLVTIWAEDLNDKSYDNCTDEEDLRYSFSLNINHRSATFGCPPNGISHDTTLNIYVWDDASPPNWEVCQVRITIQDGVADVCPDNLTGGGSGNIIAGKISNDQLADLESAQVILEGNMAGMPKAMVTGQTGEYIFTSLPQNENYTIRAIKDDNPLNGVTTADILAIQKHILGISPFNKPIQFIAADANSSESVTASDISEIRRLILGKISRFSNNTSWRFLRSGQVFVDPNSPFPFEEQIDLQNLSQDEMHQDFTAVKIADINGDAKTNVLSAGSRSDLQVKFIINDLSFKTGEIIEIPVAIADNIQATGLQMALNLDETFVEFIGLESDVLQLDPRHYHYQNGQLRISYDAAKGMKLTSAWPLIKIVARAIKNESVVNIIGLDELIMPAELYTPSEVATIKMDMRDASGSDVIFALHQNIPNPFSEYTDVSFSLPNSEYATISILDMTGREIYRIEKEFLKGMNTVRLSKDKIQAEGVLYYQLETSKNRAVRKMIMLRP